MGRFIGDYTTMPNRYRVTGTNMEVESFTKAANGSSYQTSNCNLRTGTACSSHATGGDGTMTNW
jgi:hypothetical protein